MKCLLLVAGLLCSKPVVLKQVSGDYLVPAAAWSALDNELRRLQALEQVHKQESWLGVFAVGALVGLLVSVPLALWVPRAQTNSTCP